jgi:hypothetical protein
VFMNRGGRPADPVARAVQILSSTDVDLTDLDDAIDIIVRKRHWLSRKQQGDKTFTMFADFAIAPEGLGISTIKRMRPVRNSLLVLGHYGELVNLLQRTMRPRGRPPKKNAKDNIFRRFWPAPRSRGTVDYILLALERDHPEVFKAVCDGKEKYRDAARRLGLLPATSKVRWGVDIAAIRALPAKAQGDLMCKLCEMVGVDAHCAMLSRIFEQQLGPGLAERWRETSGATRIKR